jgi:hypothetical protein
VHGEEMLGVLVLARRRRPAAAAAIAVGLAGAGYLVAGGTPIAITAASLMAVSAVTVVAMLTSAGPRRGLQLMTGRRWVMLVLAAVAAAALREACGPGRASVRACLAALNRLGYREPVTYQPVSRFWAFQWCETAVFLALALALAGFCFWWIRHRLA